MKRLIILSILSIFLNAVLLAQPTFVPTTPSNKNVVLEEYTGIYCGNCPDGHKRANEIVVANPGRVVLINIHQGTYANATPNYKTQWGDALANQMGLRGYPAGTINRRVFVAGITDIDRTEFVEKSNIILAEPSILNIASKAYIDTITRIITIDVEVYYTSDADSKINMLNVALLQDSIIGPQEGKEYNPSNVTADGKYIHNHMLRHLFSNQFGDAIIGEENIIPSGSFFTKRYVYQLPQDINNIPLVLKHLHVAAFVAKSNQDIYTGALANMYLGRYNNAVEPSPSILAIGLNAPKLPISCEQTTSIDTIKFKVKNTGTNTINNLLIKYKQDTNNIQTLSYNTPINSGDIANIILPQSSVSNDGKFTSLWVFVSELNGISIETEKGIIYATSIANPPMPKEAEGNVILYLKTDNYGSEIKWSVKDLNGNIIKRGGPYQDGAERYDTVKFNLPAIGCYIFEITDMFADGISSSGEGEGNYQLVDNNGTILINSDGKYAMGEKRPINLKSLIGLNDIEEITSSISLFPNPAKDNITIESTNIIDKVEFYNSIGLKVLEYTIGGKLATLKTNTLSKGIYLLKVFSSDRIEIKKIIIE